MSELPAPVNFAPLGSLLLLGALIAIVPLSWVWLRQRGGNRRARLAALTALTVFLTFDLIVFGAFTRLTDSGLGCPDWPGCYGQVTPVGAAPQISAAEAASPNGPVTLRKAWIEMIHRYLAMMVGALILVLALATWWERWRPTGAVAPGEANGQNSVAGSNVNGVNRVTGVNGVNGVNGVTCGTSGTSGASGASGTSATTGASGSIAATGLPLSPWWPTLTLVWVLLQGLFGKYTVTLKLYPAVVTLHLMGGLALLALLAFQREAYLQRSTQLPASLRRGTWAALLLLTVQVALGGWVSTNYAVVACTGFPQCSGQWWPAMDFNAGFEILHPLGQRANGSGLPLQALVAIHMVHRGVAVLVALALGWLAWCLWRLDAGHGLRRSAGWLAAVLALQWATGLANVLLGWPMAAALLHTAGAAALVWLLTLLLACGRAVVRAVAVRS
jgi:heme a synthase